MGRAKLLEVYSASSDRMLLDQLVRCNECSLVYLNPRIRKELILESYAAAVDPGFIEQNEERIRTFERSLQHLTSHHGLKPARTTNILDVGCAGGAFLKAAADRGFTVVGVEPSRWLSDDARTVYGLDVRTGVLGEQNLAPESFDAVTLWDVIEHLAEPADTVTEIHGLLKPGSLLVVNYPNYDSLARRLLRGRWPFLLSVHLVYFTTRTLTRMLEERGFEVLETRAFWQTLQLGYVLSRASAYVRGCGVLCKATHRLGIARWPITYNVGQSLLVARKKP